MPIDIHTDAEANFNAKALELVSQLEDIPESRFTDKQESFPSETIPVQEIGPEKIKGPGSITETDYSGHPTAAFFSSGDKTRGLLDQAHLDFSTLVKKVSDAGNVSALLSDAYIREKLLEWIAAYDKNGDAEKPFVAHLKACAQNDVDTFDVFLPIAYLEVETEFPFVHSLVTPLSSARLDEWADGVSKLHGVSVETAHEWLADITKTYQGLAAVKTTVQAEPQLAAETGLKNAKQTISVLALFSPAILIPDLRCVSSPVGADAIRSYMALMHTSKGDIGRRGDLDDATVGPFWRISKAELEQNMRMRLKDISDIYTKEKRSDLETRFLNFIEIYSRAAFTANSLEKVIFTLSALESLLLKDENEAIQQNLGERMAFLIGGRIDEKRDIIKTVQSVYGLRSKFLHHGRNIDKRERVSRFLQDAKLVFRIVLANVPNFQDKKSFVSAIEDEKLRP